MRAAAIFAAFFLMLTATAAACPKTTLPEIENDVMCPICGTTLGNAGGPQAQREREFIRERVEQCQSEAQIKRALVAEYGEEVLARPSTQGFQLTAYVVPALTALLAGAALFAGVMRWRRTPRRPAAATSATAPGAGGGPDRIDDDLQNYDL